MDEPNRFPAKVRRERDPRRSVSRESRYPISPDAIGTVKTNWTSTGQGNPRRSFVFNEASGSTVYQRIQNDQNTRTHQKNPNLENSFDRLLREKSPFTDYGSPTNSVIDATSREIKELGK
jgi:hypothetical protein